MGIACMLILLAGTPSAEEGPSRPLFDIGESVEVTVADAYRAKGISVQRGRLELTGRLVAQDAKTLTVTSLDGAETVRYPAAGAYLAGTVIALDDDWLTLDLGDGRPHVRVPLTAIIASKVPDSPQEADGALIAGARVRVHLSDLGGGSVTGRVLRIDDGSLLLRTPNRTEPLLLERSSIWKTEVSLGRRNEAKRGFIIGASVVGVLGAGFGYLVGSLACEGGCGPLGPSKEVVLFGTVGGICGGMAGSLIGSAVETERWQAVSSTPVSVSVAPRPHGGVSASLSFRF